MNFTIVVSAQEGTSLQRGRILYEKHCAICHGIKGDGQGEVASLFRTKPRDFTKGEYKIKSTPSGSPPSDEDIFHSVKSGMPGTAMVPQTQLQDEEIRLVVDYIKSLSSRFTQNKPGKSITLPPAPPFSLEQIAQGKVVYQKSQCFQCHGPEGKGDGILAKDLTIKPADLTQRPLKSGASTRDIVRTLLTGIEGTPMPPYQFMIEDNDLWNVAYYVEALGGPPQQTDDEKKGWEIVKNIHIKDEK